MGERSERREKGFKGRRDCGACIPTHDMQLYQLQPFHGDGSGLCGVECMPHSKRQFVFFLRITTGARCARVRGE